MIRPFTCLTLLFAAGSGLYLYSAKHKVEMLDRDIAKLEKTAQDNRARAGLLHAQYDLLGDPERLRALATQLLTLQPTAPGQFTTMAELGNRLPPPGPLPAIQPAPATDPAPAADTATPPGISPAARPEPDQIAQREAEKPAEPPAEHPAARPVAVLAEKAAPPPAARPSPPVVAALAPPHAAAPPAPVHSAPFHAPPPRAMPPVHPAPVVVARRAPEPRPTPLAPAEPIARAVQSTPVNATVPMVASALGMARAMMVQPYPPPGTTGR